MRVPFRRSFEILRTEGPRVFFKELARTGWDRVRMRLFRAYYAQHLNIRHAQREWQAKSLVMHAGPREMTITSTTYCNLKCVMCEHAIPGMVDRAHMDVDLVGRLAGLIPTTDCFQLHGLGEPLMSPAFWKLLDEIGAAHRGVPYITINSNGLLLNGATISRILDSKLKEINISIDAASEDTYAKIRGGDFCRLLANVEALVTARHTAGRDDFRILLNMTLMRANIEELPEFVRLAKRLGVDGVAFWQLNDGENYERPEWVVDKGDWRFAYCDESLLHYPRLANEMIRAAVRTSEEIRMPIIENHYKSRRAAADDTAGEAPVQPSAPSGEVRPAELHQPSPGAFVPVASLGWSDRTAGMAVAAQPAPITTGTCASRNECPSDEPAATASSEAAPKSATIGQCDAPWRWLLVNERGDCSPCCYAQQTIGNLRDQTAAENWNGATLQ